MSVRRAVVAGQFYPADPRVLRAGIARFFANVPASSKAVTSLPGAPQGVWTERRPLLTMLPHAGHIYCGPVIAAALKGIDLPQRLVILAPNHTGAGHPLGYWPDGAWETPLGRVPVDAELGEELRALGGGFAPDETPHRREHDIEVLLPFLQTVRPDARILPIVAGGAGGQLAETGRALAALVRAHVQDGRGDVALILSSDMNHYADESETRRLDSLALDAFLALDPRRLADVVQSQRISMCGILPALIALTAARELGASQARLAAYDTSGSASGDARRVVGYAGVRVW